MILGHITGTVVAVKALHREAKIDIVLVTVFGACFPDIIDKPIHLLGWGEPRGLGHTLVFLVAATLFLLSIFRKRSHVLIYTAWFFFGCVLHLVGDFAKLQLVMWPLMGPIPPIGERSVVDMLTYLKKPSVRHILALELFCHICFAVLLWRRYRHRTVSPRAGEIT